MTDLIRQAATMILIRDGEKGLQVYMTRRPDTMLFLPGYYVFPGGGMQSEDRDERIFSCCQKRDLAVDLSYAITAIRECYEEVGYLLADVNGRPAWEQADFAAQLRQQIESGAVTFHDWVLSAKPRLRTDLIRYYGHRITPRTVSTRRFDTRYFLTVVPPHVKLAPCRQEVAHAEWMEPAAALEQAKSGAIHMVPPTMDALADLACFSNTAEAFRYGAGVGNPRPHESR
ncbi:NUDIX hydrolase [Effusibacillus pohliae]|uniref:NUDIX hydrolase n=1 Tax=Effusibacillus pohliae TaxID=232270 RepID=UPI00037175F0|nr:NUDIX domain-containing protein [Effusibacillus pohliae]